MAENAQLTSATGALNGDINSILAAQTLPIAENTLRFYQAGEKLQNADGTGKIWKAIRFNRISLPTVALTEGTTPDGSSLSTTTVTGTAEQWGAYITLTDVGLLTLVHPVLAKSNELLGEAAGELIDREIQKVLESATNIYYGAGTTRPTLSGTGILATSVVARMVAGLRNNGAKPIDGSNFLGVIDPSVEMDIILESKFITYAQYQNAMPLLKGEIGTWMGVRWVRSNFMRSYYGAGIQVATTGSGTSGMASGIGYSVSCVGRSAAIGLKIAVSDYLSGVVTTTGVGLSVTMPDDPTGYIWDAYVGSGTGSTPLLCVGVSATGKTGGAVVQVNYVGTGAAAPSSPVSGATIHNVWIFGKGGFGVTDLTGIQRTLTPDGATDSDPLNQRRKTGFKVLFKAIILNNNFMAKGEVESAAE